MTVSPYADNRPALPSDTRVGQGTVVEQSRAAAEVQAAVVVAQQCPRDVQAAIAQMRQSCKQKALAERAFYRYSRSNQTVTGASVHLARELARCWGNIQYGLVELRRDDAFGQSEMQAFAWDVQTNSRNSSTFVVPHKRDTKQGTKSLTDMRDVYENNANNGARRVREAIFAILPPWFIAEAESLCRATLADGGGKPLEARVADAIRLFGDIGITPEQLEAKLGRVAARWLELDVVQLGLVYKGIQNGETTRDEEFPAAPVTAEEIRNAPAPVYQPMATPALDRVNAEGVLPGGVPVEVLVGEAQGEPGESPAGDAEVAPWPEAAKPGSKGGAA